MKNIVYPVLGAQTVLPFYLTGIGISNPEYHVVRESGLVSHQLLFTAEGRGVLNVGGDSFLQRKGSLFYLPPSLPHEYYPENGEWTTCWVVFRGGLASELLRGLGLESAICAADTETEKLELLFRRLLACASDPMSHDRTSSLLYEFILLAREQLLTSPKERSGGGSMIKPALDYIESAYMRDITLSELAELSGVTPQHFCRVFRSRLGVRPMEYIAKLRVSHAKVLLMDTDLPVAEIARLVGYSDQTYFGVVFKRCEGISPSRFRSLGAMPV